VKGKRPAKRAAKAAPKAAAPKAATHPGPKPAALAAAGTGCLSRRRGRPYGSFSMRAFSAHL
jgi:hypothetical protein